MNSNEKNQKHVEDEWEKKVFKDLYGVDPEMSLQTAQFATTENPLLTEYYHERNEEEE